MCGCWKSTAGNRAIGRRLYSRRSASPTSLHEQGAAFAPGRVLRGLKPAAAAAASSAIGSSKIPILPSGTPHTAGTGWPSVPHSAERTWTLAAVSCACRALSERPPPLHWSEPVALNTLIPAARVSMSGPPLSPPPHAANDATAKTGSNIRISVPLLAIVTTISSPHQSMYAHCESNKFQLSSNCHHIVMPSSR